MGSKKKAERKHILSKKCWCKPKVESFKKLPSEKTPYNLPTALRVIELKDQAIAKLNKQILRIKNNNRKLYEELSSAAIGVQKAHDERKMELRLQISGLQGNLNKKENEIFELKREVSDYQRVLLGYMVTTFVKPIVDAQKGSAEVRK